MHLTSMFFGGKTAFVPPDPAKEAVDGGCMVPAKVWGLCAKTELDAALAFASAEEDAVVRDGLRNA